MRTLFFLTGVLPLVGALMAVEHRQASAYIDGGTTSVLIQMLVGGSLAGMFAVKAFWSQVVIAVRKVMFWR